jgi:hypothetical protein
MAIREVESTHRLLMAGTEHRTSAAAARACRSAGRGCVGGYRNLPTGGHLLLPADGHLNADSDQLART